MARGDRSDRARAYWQCLGYLSGRKQYCTAFLHLVFILGQDFVVCTRTYRVVDEYKRGLREGPCTAATWAVVSFTLPGILF